MKIYEDIKQINLFNVTNFSILTAHSVISKKNISINLINDEIIIERKRLECM